MQRVPEACMWQVQTLPQTNVEEKVKWSATFICPTGISFSIYCRCEDKICIRKQAQLTSDTDQHASTAPLATSTPSRSTSPPSTATSSVSTSTGTCNGFEVGKIDNIKLFCTFDWFRASSHLQHFCTCPHCLILL